MASESPNSHVNGNGNGHVNGNGAPSSPNVNGKTNGSSKVSVSAQLERVSSRSSSGSTKVPGLEGVFRLAKNFTHSLKKTHSAKAEPSEEIDSERTQLAAAIIARNWRDQHNSYYLSKKNLIDRLQLEDAVSSGVQRLSLYAMIFVILVLCLGVGVPSSEKLAVKHLVSDVLQVDDLLEIRTLEGLRDYLPEVSDRIKQFTVSSSARFSEGDGLVVVRDRAEFQTPRSLFTVDFDITIPSWTFSAWVERPAGSTGRVPIIRRPMESSRDLNCWGWYHPSELRYGAHDFHTLEEKAEGFQGEEVAWLHEAADRRDWSGLMHEVVVVDRGTVQFFRDGKAIAEPLRLQRPLTDCFNPATLELGAPDLALSSVKFYPRALLPAEVDEMFKGGQPLVDIATGSRLDHIEEEPLQQVGAEVSAGNRAVVEAVEVGAEAAMVSSVVANGGEEETDDMFDAIWPPDDSPVASLPKGIEVAHYLPARELEAWEAAGRPTDLYRNGAGWQQDADVGGQYWSVFHDPVHLDGSAAGSLPDFPADADGVTISFWFKLHRTSRVYGPHLQLTRDPVPGLPGLVLDLRLQLDWVTISLRLGDDQSGWDTLSTWRFLTVMNDDGSINEKYLPSTFAREEEPIVWRHVVYQYSRETRSILFYLDSKLVLDTREDDLPKWDAQTLSEDYTMNLLFSTAFVFPHSWARQGGYIGVPGKMAQLRFYPRFLSQQEIEMIHNTATWGPLRQPVRQCVEPATDNSFHDTIGVDKKGHSCSWFSTVSREYPYLCAPNWAKNMCPMTCSGRRTCHDGRLRSRYQPPEPRRRFRVFERIMFLRPRDGKHSVICPSNTIDRATVKATCERNRALDAQIKAGGDSNGFYRSTNQFDRFLNLYERTFSEIDRADLRECDEIVDRMDEEQCQWDGSWLDEFEKDFNETKTWSITMWIKPKDESFGMPNNFFFAVHLFSSLAPPLNLMDFNERSPRFEPWLDAYSSVGSLSDHERAQRGRLSIWPTTLVDYKQWTMLHMQVQYNATSDSYRTCGTMNAIPLYCTSEHGPPLFSPREFMTALEVTTEMLVSPIEVTTEMFSAAEVQQYYYRLRPEMAKVYGPSQSEVARLDALAVPRVKETTPFDHKIFLVAPPLLFQTRTTEAGCDSEVAQPILGAQLDLMTAAHCKEVLCPNLTTPERLVSCPAEVESKPYYGLTQSTLGSREGYADFLYSMDSPILVRDGQTLESRRFLDGQTTECLIVAIFHSPSSGLTTEVILSADLSGRVVECDAEFLHYGYVDDSDQAEFLAIYAIFFICVACGFLVNLNVLRHLMREVRLTHKQHRDKEWFESVGDLTLLTGLVAFVSVVMAQQLSSKNTALGILDEMASVPFADAETAMEQKVQIFFQAIETLKYELDNNSRISIVAFVMLMLLLVRVIESTAVHPRTRLLVGTLWHALNDLWHFSILFLIVFFCFSYVASWMFGDSFDEFADLRASMRTQFFLIMGELYEDFDTDERMVVYVVLTVVVQFFLMLNFLLAIVVEGYMHVRKDIEENESEKEFFTDVGLTAFSWFKMQTKGWPDRRRMVFLLKSKVGSRAISRTHLFLLEDMPRSAVTSFFDHYYGQEQLRTTPPATSRRRGAYDVADPNDSIPHRLAILYKDVSDIKRFLDVPDRPPPKRKSRRGSATGSQLGSQTALVPRTQHSAQDFKRSLLAKGTTPTALSAPPEKEEARALVPPRREISDVSFQEPDYQELTRALAAAEVSVEPEGLAPLQRQGLSAWESYSGAAV